MHQKFTDSVQIYQAACKMHPELGGNSELRSFARYKGSMV